MSLIHLILLPVVSLSGGHFLNQDHGRGTHPETVETAVRRWLIWRRLLLLLLRRLSWREVDYEYGLLGLLGLLLDAVLVSAGQGCVHR